jgi:lysophospholipase L1-like esterase
MIWRILVFSFLFVAPLASQIRVVNEGFPGQNTAELDLHLEAALVRFRPEYVILFAGANDALNEKKFLPAQKTEAHLTSMVQHIQAHGAEAIMVTVHDPDLDRLMKRHKLVDYGDRPPLQRLKEVNLKIEQVAASQHAKLVPFSQVLKQAGGADTELSTDGVHLTAKGYGLLARAVRDELAGNIPSDTVILCFGDSLTYGIGVRPPNDAPETSETYPAQLRALLK